jgi:hypothetical protein
MRRAAGGGGGGKENGVGILQSVHTRLLKYSQRMKEKSGMFYLMLYRRRDKIAKNRKD